MKKANHTLSEQIRKQMDDRETVPSRDLWSEIESQSAVKNSKPSFNWLLTAACFILTFSLGAVLFLNQENKPAGEPEKMAKTLQKPAVQRSAEHGVNEKQKGLIVEIPEQKTTTENISAAVKNDGQKQEPQAFIQQEELPVVRQNSTQVIPELSPVKPEKTIAQADSVRTQVKKKRYVDPSTLLFSVEHKDAIQKSKGKSNVASIEISGN